MKLYRVEFGKPHSGESYLSFSDDKMFYVIAETHSQAINKAIKFNVEQPQEKPAVINEFGLNDLKYIDTVKRITLVSDVVVL